MTPPAEVYAWTVNSGAARDIPTEVTIGFEAGVPVSLDGEPDRAVRTRRATQRAAGRHGMAESTTSRTGSWASRVARATRRRPRSCSTPRMPRWRG